MEVKNVSNTTNGGFETSGSKGGRYMFTDGGPSSYRSRRNRETARAPTPPSRKPRPLAAFALPRPWPWTSWTRPSRWRPRSRRVPSGRGWTARRIPIACRAFFFCVFVVYIRRDDRSRQSFARSLPPSLPPSLPSLSLPRILVAFDRRARASSIVSRASSRARSTSTKTYRRTRARATATRIRVASRRVAHPPRDATDPSRESRGVARCRPSRARARIPHLNCDETMKR